jgi:hypothetical protein
MRVQSTPEAREAEVYGRMRLRGQRVTAFTEYFIAFDGIHKHDIMLSSIS